jgi:hypothetical protein
MFSKKPHPNPSPKERELEAGFLFDVKLMNLSVNRLHFSSLLGFSEKERTKFNRMGLICIDSCLTKFG